MEAPTATAGRAVLFHIQELGMDEEHFLLHILTECLIPYSPLPTTTETVMIIIMIIIFTCIICNQVHAHCDIDTRQ